MRRVDEFAHTMTLEMGKRISEARGEVEFSSNILAYYAKNAERFLAPRQAASDPRRRPYGEQPDRRDLRRRALELSPTTSSRGSPVRI
jgi:acyl-CoA reductase-like NAD-dependent aldehyde dehydrogenase